LRSRPMDAALFGLTDALTPVAPCAAAHDSNAHAASWARPWRRCSVTTRYPISAAQANASRRRATHPETGCRAVAQPSANPSAGLRTRAGRAFRTVGDARCGSRPDQQLHRPLRPRSSVPPFPFTTVQRRSLRFLTCARRRAHRCVNLVARCTPLGYRRSP
jgi:hypothetical protein